MFADVIVDIASSEVDRIFEYSFTDERILPGTRVSVPFANKIICGFVIAVKETSDFDPKRIKPVYEVLDDVPALTEEEFSLMNYIRKKYFVPAALALRLFLPSEMRLGKVKNLYTSVSSLAVSEAEAVTAAEGLRKSAVKQKALIERLINDKTERTSILNSEFGNTAVKKLEELGVIKTEKVREYRSPYKNIDCVSKNVTLTEAQSAAVKSVTETDKLVTLLFGVTGSGKTEVYLNLINNAISSGKTAIMLVPEIALTPQMLRQLRARFGDNAAILHSGLSAGEKFDEWWRIKSGEAKIVIGARSAIFAPIENIGIIIIDEEHDSSYQSEQAPRYDTLDIAKFRAKAYGAKIVIGSATPSIESYMRAQNGEYNLATLPERINKNPLPEVIIADMKKETRRGNASIFSAALKDELEDCLKKGNQAILFLNQRGYSKSVICTECGHVHKCDACDVALTYHAEDDSLLCHYCGAKYKMITSCVNCGSKYLRYNGYGTEKVVKELGKLFPEARVLRMDRDTTSTKEGHFKILSDFSERKADILVGTQMIAKGHDFPKVTLVGILDADMSLHFSDFRSGERTFQLITQVAGRSGRADEKGKVVLQTYTPENFILQQAVRYDYKKMYESEISIRKATGFPPFTDIIRVVVSSESEDEAVVVTKNIYGKISEYRDKNKGMFKFLAAMKAPLKRIQNKFRYQIITRITAGEEDAVSEMNRYATECSTRNCSAYVEVNPNNLS